MLGCIAGRFLWLHLMVSVAACLAPIGWIESPLCAQSLAPSPDSDVEALIVRLKYPQAPQRLAAARRIAEMGPQANQAASTLALCLTDPSADVRVAAAYALARVSTDGVAAIRSLQPVLSDASEHVRYSAQWSVAKLASELPLDLDEAASKMTVELLEKSLKDIRSYDHQTRHTTIIESVITTLRSNLSTQSAATKTAPPNDTIDSAKLISGLYEPNDFISRLQIIRRLKDRTTYPGTIRQKVLLFESTQIDTVLLDYAMACWGSEAQEDLAAILNGFEQEKAFPETAFMLVEQVCPTEATMVAQLKSWSRDPSLPTDLRVAALRAISQSKHDVTGCVEWLAQSLTDTDLQINACYALSSMGTAAAPAQSQLMSALMQSREEAFQMAGALAIPEIAPDSPIAAQFFTQWLRIVPRDSSVLPFILDAIAEYGSQATSAIPMIRQQLYHFDPNVRISAMYALRSMRAQAVDAVPDMITILTSTNEDISIKNRAARTLRRIGPASVQPLMQAIATTSSPKVLEDLLRALAVVGTPAAEAQLLCIQLVNNVEVPVAIRIAAANAIGSMGPSAQSQVAPLLAQCKDDVDPTLQAVCLLSAARVNPTAAKQTVLEELESPWSIVLANAAYGAHLCGESRMAFDTLLSMLDESETDIVIKEALEELGDSVLPWLIEEAENTERSDSQRLACCDLASVCTNPDWKRLLKLVDDNYLGQKFADHLSYHWHPVIACNVKDHMAEVETLVTLVNSTELSTTGRARLEYLLLPDGLGAGDDDGEWSDIALSKSASLELLGRNDREALAASAIGPSTPKPSKQTAQPPASARFPEASEESGGARIDLPEAMDAQLVGAEDSAPAVEGSIEAVDVYYGTNRQRDPSGNSVKEIVIAILITTIGSVITLGFAAIGSFSRGARVVGILSVVGLFVFGSFGFFAAKQLSVHPVQALVTYNHRVSDKVEYGKCTVTIPPNHQKGMVEAPMLLKGQFISDPNKHIVLNEIHELTQDQFLADLKDVQARKGKNLLVFIHGYNVSFEDAAKRTAQMQFDLKFPGAAIFYSWPSQANWYGYKSDKERIEMSVGQIRHFLEDLAKRSGAETINLVAHSMGNVGLTAALKDIQSTDGNPIFNQVVLAAPDIDAETFKNDIARHIVTKAKRMTLYTSKTDLALIASRYFNNGSRLGDSGPEVVTYPGIDTIDATTIDSSLLGHSYYGSNITVLTDVGHLLRNEPLAQRVYLRPVQDGEQSYWTFDPVLISKLNPDLSIRK